MRNKRVKKSKSKNKSKLKKSFGALALTMLLLTGGAFALPINDDSLINNSFHGEINALQQNSMDLANWENLNIPLDFDYIAELNKEFTADFPTGIDYSLNEDALKESVKTGNYEKWKEILEEVNGSPDGKIILPLEEFEILVQLRNFEEAEEFEE
jgi:hypothetical protein